MRRLKQCIAVFSILSAVVLGFATPAAADALDDALRNGQVGETLRGYIAAVKSPDGAVTRLINSINE